MLANTFSSVVVCEYFNVPLSLGWLFYLTNTLSNGPTSCLWCSACTLLPFVIQVVSTRSLFAPSRIRPPHRQNTKWTFYRSTRWKFDYNFDLWTNWKGQKFSSVVCRVALHTRGVQKSLTMSKCTRKNLQINFLGGLYYKWLSLQCTHECFLFHINDKIHRNEKRFTNVFLMHTQISLTTVHKCMYF